MAEKIFCPKCQKTMAPLNFYQYPNGQKCEICKSCLTMHINTYDEETFLWILEKFDVPYIPAEWKKRREAEFEKAYNKAAANKSKDPENAAYNMTKGNGVVFGKYLAQMKLTQWKKYHWADTEKLKIEAEEKAKLYGAGTTEEMEEQVKSVKEAYEKGEISEAQYKTYLDLNPQEQDKKTLEDKFLEAGGPSGVPTGPTQNPYSGDSAYPVNAHPFEVVDIPDPGADLTNEDKLYLAVKWGRLYSAADWVWLEQKYNAFMESFDIQGAARIDTLIAICKTSLKMNQALDAGDIDTYQKLARVYDALMKSGKFTEAQRKEERSGEFDSVGQIVYFAEKEKGKIGRHEFEYQPDLIDEAINNLKRYNKDLIQSDSSLAQQIENYLKRRIGAEDHAKDLAEAKAMGFENIELEDEDIIDYKNLEHEWAEDDFAATKGEGK